MRGALQLVYLNVLTITLAKYNTTTYNAYLQKEIDENMFVVTLISYYYTMLELEWKCGNMHVAVD